MNWQNEEDRHMIYGAIVVVVLTLVAFGAARVFGPDNEVTKDAEKLSEQIIDEEWDEGRDAKR